MGSCGEKSSGPQITQSSLLQSGKKDLRPFFSPKVSTRFQRVCCHPNLLGIVGREAKGRFTTHYCRIPFTEVTVSIERRLNMSISFPQVFVPSRCRHRRRCLPQLLGYQSKLRRLELGLCRSLMGENRLLSPRPAQLSSSSDGRRVHAPSG